jgi:hypothetical protein
MTTTESPLLATRGQLAFDDSIEPAVRPVISEMWTNRLAGFHAIDLKQYLRDNDSETRYIINGRHHSFKAFRRVCRVLFALQHVFSRIGLMLKAEAIDPVVTERDGSFETRATLILTIGRRWTRQSKLRMTIEQRNDRWVWGESDDRKIRKRDWPVMVRRIDGAIAYECANAPTSPPTDDAPRN